MNQTNYILSKFKVEPPQVITDVSPRVKDVGKTNAVFLNINSPLSVALEEYNRTG